MSDLDNYVSNYYEEVETIEDNLQAIKNTETYGTGAYKISEEDIKNLKDGKLLVVYPNDEYTCIFKYDEEGK